jgi:hypothetical protein
VPTDAPFDATADALVDAPPPDAPPAVATRAGLIVVTQVTVSNPEAQEFGGFGGAVVSVVFSDLSTATVPPVYDSIGGGITGCTVFTYDLSAGEGPPVAVDEGLVSVGATGHSPFSCSFVDQASSPGYLCSPQSSSAAGPIPTGSVIAPQDGGAVAVDVIGADFAGLNPRGMWLTLSGLANDANNGAWPVLQLGGSSSQLIIFNPQAVLEPVQDQGAYTLVVGAGPIPGVYSSFLDEDKEVTVTKASGDELAGFTATAFPNGGGLALQGLQPHELPLDNIESVTFTCDGAINTCGKDDGGAINWMVVSMVANDGSLAGAGPFDLGHGATRSASLQCRSLADAVVIPQEAMEAFLSIGPTRIETRVLRLADLPQLDDLNRTHLGIGHGVVGFTTVP